jgi:hypothetical protein
VRGPQLLLLLSTQCCAAVHCASRSCLGNQLVDSKDALQVLTLESAIRMVSNSWGTRAYSQPPLVRAFLNFMAPQTDDVLSLHACLHSTLALG